MLSFGFLLKFFRVPNLLGDLPIKFLASVQIRLFEYYDAVFPALDALMKKHGAT